MKPTIDSILFGLVQKNNIKAFSELYKRYWLIIYKSIYLRTMDEALTREIVQNIFVAMWEKRSIIHISNSCNHYLTQEAKHRTMDWAVEENILAVLSESPDSIISEPSVLPDFNGSLPALRKRLLEWYDSFAEPDEELDKLDMSAVEEEILHRIFDNLHLEVPLVEEAGKRRFVFPELALRLVTAIMVLLILGGIWELLGH